MLLTRVDVRRLTLLWDQLLSELRQLNATQQELHGKVESLASLLNPVKNTDDYVEHSDGLSGEGDHQKPLFTIATKTELSHGLISDYRSNQEESSARERQSLLAAWLTFVALVIYAGFTYFIWRTMEKQSVAMNAQLAAMRKQTEISERPWVTVDLAPNGPLTFSYEGIRMNFGALIKNVGKSVAVKAMIHAKMVAVKDEKMSTDPAKRQAAMCNQIRDTSTDSSLSGIYLFSGEGTIQGGGVLVDAKDVAAAVVPIGKFTPEYETINLFLFGCVDYQFAFSPEHHQTRFIYSVVRGKDPNLPFAIEVGKSVPPSNLMFQRDFFGGNYPD